MERLGAMALVMAIGASRARDRLDFARTGARFCHAEGQPDPT